MPAWELTPISPQSISVALPDRVVRNPELCIGLDTTPEWIEEWTGIRERRHLAAGESLVDLAVTASVDALDVGRLRPGDVDVVVAASSTPDWVLPSLGVRIAHELGIEGAHIVDITQHACVSAVTATHTAACLLQEPALRTALVVCAEAASRHTDPSDRTTRVFFGDAAGAMVVQTTAPGTGLLSYDLGYSYSEAVSMAGAGQLMVERERYGAEQHTRFLNHDARAVLREVSAHLPRSIEASLHAADVTAADVHGFALHQANVRLVERLGRRLGVDDACVPITADVLGNTGAASPLTALWQLAREGRAKQGNTVVLAAIGAGFLWGSLCFTLSDDILVRE